MFKHILDLSGFLCGIIGTVIVVKGTLTTQAAQIRHRWSEVEKGWEREKPSWFRKLTCHIAKRFGSPNVLDTQFYTIEDFQTNFWGFTFLFFGFVLQALSYLVELKLLCA